MLTAVLLLLASQANDKDATRCSKYLDSMDYDRRITSYSFDSNSLVIAFGKFLCLRKDQSL